MYMLIIYIVQLNLQKIEYLKLQQAIEKKPSDKAAV